MSSGNWFDEVGNRWEKEGVSSGHIFEFHEQLSLDLLPGGMVQTTQTLPEGYIPTHPLHILRVYVKHAITGEEITMSGRTPLVVAKFKYLAFV